MKLTLPLILIAALGTLSAQTAPAPVESTIQAVTVYPDRALVTRTAQLALAAGEHELAFDRLPASLNAQSLLVAGGGTAQATILDVRSSNTFVDHASNPRVKDLENQLQRLLGQQRQLTDQQAVLQNQRDFLVKIQSGAAQPNEGRAASLDELRQLFAFSSEFYTELNARGQELDRQLTDLKARITALEAQLGELRSGRGRTYKIVVIRVQVNKPGNLALSLSYSVPEASWQAAYDARFHSSTKEIALTYQGVVRQSTGEDWTDVELTLSTARPSLGGSAPSLPPWIVDQARPVPPPAPVSTFSRAVVGGAAQEAMVAADAFKMAEASLEAAATSATFRITNPARIPSDNTPHKVGITSATLASTARYETTPKLQPVAFLSAKAENATEFPFFAGTVSVFLDDTFVATSSIKSVMPGESFDLALGADEGLKVERKLVRRVTEDAGIVSKVKVVRYEFLISLTNHKRTPEKIAVHDHLPVSRYEKIVVKVAAPPEREVKADSEGQLTWVIDLKPGEKRELPLRFSVEYPADLSVIGLE